MANGRTGISKAFTLVELMVVILIVGILAAVAIPVMQGKVDSAKWSEANSAAGTIRSAVRVYVNQYGVAAAQASLVGEASGNLTALGFAANELEGTYFTAADYNIDSITADGIAVVTVTASKGNGPSGSRTLKANGDFD